MVRNKDPKHRTVFTWGAINGLIFGIILRHGLDISEGGIALIIVDAFKPLFREVGMSVLWFKVLVILLGIISLLLEMAYVYSKEKGAISIVSFAFLGMLFLILGLDGLGIIFLITSLIVVILTDR